MLPEHFNRLSAVARCEDIKAKIFEHSVREPSQRVIVFNQQHCTIFFNLQGFSRIFRLQRDFFC